MAGRIESEKRVIGVMVAMYCRHHHRDHSRRGDLCSDCANLLDYAHTRLTRCPLGEKKPTCARCHIHCYAGDQRDRIKAVMRYAGPRMLLRHPVVALAHFLRELG